jgi:hypothetical protein
MPRPASRSARPRPRSSTTASRSPARWTTWLGPPHAAGLPATCSSYSTLAAGMSRSTSATDCLWIATTTAPAAYYTMSAATYRRHFLQARRIVSGCEDLTLDPGAPLPSAPTGPPASDAVCVPDAPNWPDQSGVGYSRGCGPPVEIGTTLRHFIGAVGWIGESGRLIPPGAAGVHLHLGLDVGTTIDSCHWPFQPPGLPIGQPPSGGESCLTTWADPLQFLPQVSGDSLIVLDDTPVPIGAGEMGDPTLDGAPFQLPPPGHPAGMRFSAPENDRPAGSWWSPGNDDRATNTGCPLGGPTVTNWLLAVLRWLFPWWFGC